jgi:fatty acid desaturase
MNHPHDLLSARIPNRLPAAELQVLSQVDAKQALVAIGLEWLIIVSAVAAAKLFEEGLVTLVAIIVIGARQHALTVIAHDASHVRLLQNSKWNDRIGNLLLAWPTFSSVQGFRRYHGLHHRFLASRGDGNRILWGTHDGDGKLKPEWIYPKTPARLVLKIFRRAMFLTGFAWIVRCFRGLFLGGPQFGMTPKERLTQVLFYCSIATVLILTRSVWTFLLLWIVPYCTWHIAAQYTRLVCEHSNIVAKSGYHLTRTTVASLVQRFFFLPRNIGYHIEHHWYPSVPFYRLPELHARLMKDPEFANEARIFSSLWASIRDATTSKDGRMEAPAEIGTSCAASHQQAAEAEQS